MWPNGAPAPVDNGIQGQGIEGYVIPGANVEGQYELICALYPTSLTSPLGGGGEGGIVDNGGPPPPKSETDTTVSARVIAFSDPPGVSGTWDNSGNSNAAEGVVIYNPQGPSTNPNTEMAVCILAPSDHDLCTASLNDFAAHYGGLKAGQHGQPTVIPHPSNQITGPPPCSPDLLATQIQGEAAAENMPSVTKYACSGNWAIAEAEVSFLSGGSPPETAVAVFEASLGSWTIIAGPDDGT